VVQSSACISTNNRTFQVGSVRAAGTGVAMVHPHHWTLEGTVTGAAQTLKVGARHRASRVSNRGADDLFGSFAEAPITYSAPSQRRRMGGGATGVDLTAVGGRGGADTGPGPGTGAGTGTGGGAYNMFRSCEGRLEAGAAVRSLVYGAICPRRSMRCGGLTEGWPIGASESLSPGRATEISRL